MGSQDTFRVRIDRHCDAAICAPEISNVWMIEIASLRSQCHRNGGV